jgi:hypothetical protein
MTGANLNDHSVVERAGCLNDALGGPLIYKEILAETLLCPHLI